MAEVAAGCFRVLWFNRFNLQNHKLCQLFICTQTLKWKTPEVWCCYVCRWNENKRKWHQFYKTFFHELQHWLNIISEHIHLTVSAILDKLEVTKSAQNWLKYQNNFLTLQETKKISIAHSFKIITVCHRIMSDYWQFHCWNWWWGPNLFMKRQDL